MRDVEIPNWLQGLPFAPEFHPTDTEFADPIAYISKIEKEASAFGICKVIPPLPKPSKKYVLANLNKSLLKSPELGDEICSSSNRDKVSKEGESRAVFTTRQQELGLSGKKGKGGASQPQLPAAHKQVWQSGEIYTLEQFESKSKTFAKSQLSTVKEVSPLVIEALFWKAACEKPIYIDYANDVPGSGFEEPEEPFRCFHRHRRRRKRGTFSRNSRECFDLKKDQVDKMSYTNENKVELDKSVPDSSVEISKASTSSSNILLDQISPVPRQKDSNAGTEMEGTSGWKLSNSPWNLQVIARSPGSLTRFMPDDIPGVTSPMVYIGMLFSWFAWHVEDHELHSLNFLHTGSAKTWYSIPGDYAFTFEEVIRRHAYGGNIDRLAALTLLGEKTTLLSPEVVVASGIPCCRLVQNPGEFVVTFPRAYHIGFSHGFNCGEAANFGTPKWLAVAKEAAVRRAAMNHLPMLSHQQLLYLLTMSFISRVPRSLLPGVRSSRLRDRQKDERELLVKKAFVEDILNENKLLTALLRKNSSYHAVLWDLESLPSSGKESNLGSSIDADIIKTPIKNVHSENDYKKYLCSEINMYVESMDDIYVGGDDMSTDFQVDSGTLPCVACGVLGFPFMAIVQPYETALLDTVTMDHNVVQDLGNQSPMKSNFPSDLNSIADGSVSERLCVRNKYPEDKIYSDHPNAASSKTESIQTTFRCGKGQSPVSDISPSLKDSPDFIEVRFNIGWNTSTGYLRPRIFCLEHASQTEDLLHSKGGAKVLVICHSDFQKVKAHSAAIAEQIGSPFRYNEIPLDNATQDDLNLINLAIDDEDQAECGVDWTRKLNINLQQCVKLGNKSSSEKVQHALKLDGLFPDAVPCAGSSILNWPARKTRSRRNVCRTDHGKPSKSITVQKDEVLEAKSDAHLARKGGCLIQYSRRRFFKSKLSGSVTDLGKKKTGGNSSSELGVLASTKKSKVQKEKQCLMTSRNGTENSFPSPIADSLFVHAPVVENACDSTKDGFQMQNELDLAETSSEQNDRHFENSAGTLPVANGSIECSEIGISVIDEAENDLGTQCVFRTCADPLKEVGVEPEKSTQSSADEAGVGCFDKKSEERHVDCVDVNEMVQQETENTDGSTSNEPVPSTVTLINESTSEEMHSSGEDCSSPNKRELDQTNSKALLRSTSNSRSRNKSKRKREVELQMEEQFGIDGFIRSPCEGLRPRGRKNASRSETDERRILEEKPAKVVKKPAADGLLVNKDKKQQKKGSHRCDIEGCRMSFQTKAELALHRRNRCPHDGCGKKFRSHKYAVLHTRVHEDDRPLKCSWKGCKMTFKWAWARTEHLRVHTGERPYKCKIDGCGLTFRFVSDFSRHRRKTGHYVDVTT